MIKKVFLTVLIVFIFLTSSVSAEPIAYSIDNSLPANLYSIDLATGIATSIGSTGVMGDFEGLCFDRDGILYTIEDDLDRLYTVDTITGAATLVGNLNIDIEGAGLSFDSNGTLWMATWSNQTLFTIKTSTGNATQVGASGGLGVKLDGMAWDGLNLYGIGSGYGLSTDYLYNIDSALGTVSQVGALVNISLFDNAGLTVDSTGTLWGIDEITGQIFTINKIAGEASIVSMTTVGRFESLAIAFNYSQASIPTLSEWGMIFMAIMLAGSAFWMLKRPQML